MKRCLNLSVTPPLLLLLAGACAAPSQSAKTSSAPKPEYVVSPASGSTAATARGNTVPPPAGEVLVCEYEETVGSHIPRRICRSKADVERLQDETQQAMRDYRAPGTNDPKAALAPGH